MLVGVAHIVLTSADAPFGDSGPVHARLRSGRKRLVPESSLWGARRPLVDDNISAARGARRAAAR